MVNCILLFYFKERCGSWVDTPSKTLSSSFVPVSIAYFFSGVCMGEFSETEFLESFTEGMHFHFTVAESTS